MAQENDMTQDMLLLVAVTFNDQGGLERALAAGADTNRQDGLAMRMAAAMGREGFVERLMGASEEATRQLGLEEAAAAGQLGCVKMRLSQGELKGAKALRQAAGAGHLACVNALAPRADCQERGEALVSAAANGRLECARRLLELGCARRFDFKALKEAARHGQAPCVALMLGRAKERGVRLALAVARGSEASSDEARGMLESVLAAIELDRSTARGLLRPRSGL